jgi:primosomal protein N' (replication factor Y)
VQTWLPDHAAIRAAVRHDYRAFAARELEERAAFGYPPCGRAIRVTCEGARPDRADRLAEEAAGILRAAARGAPGVEILGPAPHALERLRNRWRRQILIKSAAQVPPALQAALERLGEREHLSLDPL